MKSGKSQWFKGTLSEQKRGQATISKSSLTPFNFSPFEFSVLSL